MQIPIRSIAHAEHLAARLAQALRDVGHEVDLDHVRAHTPTILGYASWADLGERLDPNGPLTRKVDWDDRNARQTAVRQRIREVFRTDRLEALIIVADLAGIAEMSDGHYVRVPSPDPDVALHRAARYLSDPRYMVRTSIRGDKHGFIAAPYLPDRYDRKIEIEALTNDRGEAEIVERGNGDRADIQRSINWLYRYTTQEVCVIEDSSIDPLVLATLGRLDWSTIVRLRCNKTCHDSDYHRVRQLPADSTLLEFLDRSPMLAHVALQTPPSCDEAGTAEAVGAHIRNCAGKEWPDDIPSEDGIRASIQVWSGPSISDCSEASAYELAFLSYCPPERLPRDPKQLHGMVVFCSAYGDTFTEVGNMTPSQFYAEFSGDWMRMLRIADGLDKHLHGYEPVTNYIDITRLIIAKSSVQSGRNGNIYDVVELDYFDRIHYTLMLRIFEGHSFESMLARYADYNLLETAHIAQSRGDGTRGRKSETVHEQYAALLASEMLPPDLRLDNPTEIIANLGFSIDKIYCDIDAYYSRFEQMIP